MSSLSPTRGRNGNAMRGLRSVFLCDGRPTEAQHASLPGTICQRHLQSVHGNRRDSVRRRSHGTWLAIAPPDCSGLAVDYRSEAEHTPLVTRYHQDSCELQCRHVACQRKTQSAIASTGKSRCGVVHNSRQTNIRANCKCRTRSRAEDESRVGSLQRQCSGHSEGTLPQMPQRRDAQRRL